jgi:hypothetical protein
VGRIGYQPLDQSIVFDGAWRVLTGQVPWRDFVMPTGLTPILMQAAAFRVLGVSWSTYVAHAALVNALGTGLVYAFLRGCGLERTVSAACAAVTAVTLCTPFGTPYMDNTAMFFSLVAVVAAWTAAQRGMVWPWAVAGAAFICGVFAKQIPTALVVPALVLAVVRHGRGARWRAAALGAAAAIVSAAVVILLLLVWGAKPGILWEYIVRIPLELSGDRQAGLRAHFFHAVAATARALPLTLAVSVLWCAAAVVGRWVWRASSQVVVDVAWCGLALLLLVAGWSFTAMTINQYENGMGLVPLAAGSCLMSIRADYRERHRVLSLTTVVFAVVSVALTVDAIRFHRAVNLTRSVQDFQLNGPGLSTWRPAADVPRELREEGFTVWATGPGYSSVADSLAPLLTRLRHDGIPFLLLGDESVVYGLTGQPSAAPFLWFHPGLVWRREREAWRDLDLWLNDNIDRYGVARVVVPDHPSWWGWTVGTFPIISQRIAPLATCESVGRYRLCGVH